MDAEVHDWGFNNQYNTKGTFYGGAGVSFNVPTESNTKFYVQLKYSYLGNKMASNLENGLSGTRTETVRGKSEAVTIGAGVRF